MIHARTDYDPIQDPRGKIGEDEPVMLFRAKDRLMPHVLEAYRSLLSAASADPTMIDAVALHIARVNKWQLRNRTQTPDMPNDAVRMD